MAETVTDESAGGDSSLGGVPAGSRRRRHWIWVVLGGVVTIVVVVSVLTVREMNRQALPPPTFASLQQTPDSSLHGTFAYLSGSQKFPTGDPKTGGPSWCVRVMAAAGSPAKNALCISATDLEGMVGPQLNWRSDGRLEVTMFRSGENGSLGPGWQKLVDVRTGAPESVPAASVPATPTKPPDPTVGPGGERVSVTNNDGHATVVLDSPAGQRTLFTASGNPSYAISPAGWSPDATWILVSDGRMLLVTTADPSTTRVLVDDLSAYGDVDSAGITPYALTGAELLAG
jgi:hypothetical protein